MTCSLPRPAAPPLFIRIASTTVLATLVATAAERVPWTTSGVHGSPEPPAPTAVQRAYPGLSFRQPLDLEFDPLRNRWWVAQEAGQLLSFAAADTGATNAAVAIDLPRHRKPFAQLLGFTFDPGHATNGYIYLAMATESGHPEGSRISRYSVVPGPAPALDPSSETVIITWRGGGHNGCCLKFGPDGMLYASTGDATSPEPPDALHTGQSLDDLLSAILRIDVRGATPDKPYRVPSDNPFVSRPGARPEVWAYGFRNPWRMAFGPDGALWVGDVGWELWETIHRVSAGYNGGWSRVEGPLALKTDQLAPTPVSRPAAAHGHHEAASITGGIFYRGQELPQLRDTYIYGDWETGKLWSLPDRPGALPTEIADTALRVVSFASDPDGSLFILDYQGGLHRLVPNPARDSLPFPRRLSETGLFSDTPRQVPARGVVPYAVNAGRWHDGASAARWIAIPGSEAVVANPAFQFPAGTVLAKTLSLESAGGRVPIETQLLHLGPEGWRAYSYQWNSNGTDAELVPANGRSEPVPRPDPSIPGDPPPRRWTFGARSDCLRCHNSWNGFVLGFQPAQLIGPGAHPITQLVDSGVVRTNAPLTAPFVLGSPYDPTLPLTLRARSWLHVNCAACHRFGAGAAVAARFAADEAIENLQAVDVPPARGGFSLPDARIIARGHPERSAAWFRINTAGAGHMPPVGSHTPDPQGSRVLADWIRHLDPGATPRPTQGPTNRITATAALAWLDATLPEPPPAGIVRAFLTGPDAAARDLFGPFAPTDLQRQTLGESIQPESLLVLRGDPAEGARLFRSESGPGCARCHGVTADAAPLAGPVLAGLAGRMDRAAILDSILNPSARLAEGFQWHEGQLEDGTEIAGFLVARSPAAIRLRAQEGRITEYPAGRVRTLAPAASSLMPEGLLSGLTAREAADLLAYLASLR